MKDKISPLHMLVADKSGRIQEHPDLLMVCRRGREWGLPRPDEIIPMPDESELFFLPGRNAVGLDPETGELEEDEEFLAVAAFAAPGYTLGGHPAYHARPDAPTLPLFAYGAVGWADERFYICAQRTDMDQRQVFKDISRAHLEKCAGALLKAYPKNRLMLHLMSNCALRYACPAARNLALGRHEAPLPISRACNARCVGCISKQEKGSKICATPQNRLNFTPTAQEVAEVMLHHCAKEKKRPICSFGQGCEGEPLTEAKIIREALEIFRAKGGQGTVNLNSNASKPEEVAALAKAGLSSLRVSLNSAREDVYARYYRPVDYTFADVRESMRQALAGGMFLSLNLLYFPGITDTEEETEALCALLREPGFNMLQMRNLNMDPEMYLELMADLNFGPAMGLGNFLKRMRKVNPDLRIGYFNPYLGQDIS